MRFAKGIPSEQSLRRLAAEFEAKDEVEVEVEARDEVEAEIAEIAQAEPIWHTANSILISLSISFKSYIFHTFVTQNP